MDEAREFSVWLLPAEVARGTFAALIHELASQHAAPAFEPHITLFAGVGRLPALTDLSAGVPVLDVHTDGTAHTPQLFKTVFARIQPSPRLLELAARVPALARSTSGYLFEPHLSLIYKALPEGVRAQLAGKIALPAAFSCDAVCVVVPSAAGWEDVGHWQIVDTLRLGA